MDLRFDWLNRNKFRANDVTFLSCQSQADEVTVLLNDLEDVQSTMTLNGSKMRCFHCVCTRGRTGKSTP